MVIAEQPSIATKRISTPYMFALKLTPVLFLGILGPMFVLLLMNGTLRKAPLFLVMPCVMGVLGYHWWATKVRILADEVDDCGDYLLVKKRGEEDEVPFSNIIDVNFSTARDGAQGRIRLTLDAPGKFGTEIIFAPPPHVYFGVTRRSEIAEDLRARIAQARLKRVGSAVGQ